MTDDRKVPTPDEPSSGNLPRTISEYFLAEIVRRTVQSVQPRRIVLFGSAAGGWMGPNSDVDLLVVVPEGVHRRQTAQTIYRSLMGLGVATDVVVVTESDIRAYADDPSLVLYPALREGRELYRAAG